MRWGLSLAIILAWVCPAWCGGLTLVSPRVYNGELAILRWDGVPLSFGVVRYEDRVVYLYPDPSGAIALLPIGLDDPVGDHPLLAALVDRQGRTTFSQLTLQVVRKDRPEERLNLPERMVSPSAEDLARISRESALLDAAFAGRSPRFWTTFQRPVSGPVSSIFGKRRILNGQPKSPHSGVDFREPAGAPVRSISNGRVVLVEELFYTGQTVVVDHGEGLFSLYAHLSSSSVSIGHNILKGDVLGRVGSTGRSTGPHLHLGVKLLGERIDPLALVALLEE
jgi:hypothetical protein